MNFVDLHIHSNHSSDGEWPVTKIFDAAKEVGLAAFSIADHDSVAALPQAFELAADFQGEYLANVEISTLYRQKEFHLLAPLVDWQSANMVKLLADIRFQRLEQTRERIEKLQQVGFDVTYEEVVQATGENSVTGPAIASVVLKKETNSSHPDLSAYRKPDPDASALGSLEARFYRDFFLEGRPAYAPKKGLDLETAISLVRHLKGVPVLAHPGLKPRIVDHDFLDTLRGAGLEGVEAHSSYHDEATSAFYVNLAEGLDLATTAGSDFHGKIKPKVSFGCVRQGTYRVIEELKQRRERM